MNNPLHDKTDGVAAGSGQPLTIGRILDHGVRRAPDQLIVYADQQRFTYRQLRERVGRLSAALAGIGVARGDTVGVMDWDTHRYLECFFAIPMMGAVLHTINVRLSPEQILHTINHAQDQVLIVNVDFLPLLEQVWHRLAAAPKLILCGDSAVAIGHALQADAEYESLLNSGGTAYDFPELAEHTPATMLYTSGTTGLPKGMRFSHRQIVLHTLAVQGALSGPGHGRFNCNDVYMPVTPLFHVHAWGLPYVATLLGVKQVYPGRYVPDRLVALLVTENVTFSHCVPTLLQIILTHAEIQGLSLHGWKALIGGAALPKSLAAKAMQRGVDVCCGYGMTETCPIVTTSHLDPSMEDWDLERQLELRCRAGRPIPLVDLRLVDEEMNDVAHDGVSQGEIVLRAPWLTTGYVKDETGSAALWHGGWLHTGDIGVIDALGYLKIADRLKDVIKSGGEWVSSFDLEEVIQRHPAVAEVAVIGVPDPLWVERPVALVVVKPGHSVQDHELKATVAELVRQGAMSKHSVPDHVVFVDSLPKTSVGKLDKKLMREKYIP